MKGAGKALTAISKRVKLPELQKILMNYARENQQLEMKQEVRFLYFLCEINSKQVMNDAIEDVMDDEEDEEETEMIVSQVLEEIGTWVPGCR